MVYQYGLRPAARSKSGGPSLGRSPGAHKQRRPVNQDQIQLCGEIGSTQFLEQGFVPCSFLFAASNASRSGLLHDACLLDARPLKCVTTSKTTSRCALACPQGTADGADAFAGMSSF